MIHAYHLIWGTYGFWLPNDPRGSWSETVYAWELARFGKATKSIARRDIDPEDYRRWRTQARRALKYPPVTLTGQQTQQVAVGFKRYIERSRLAVWAFSILPEHVHFVLGRQRYKVEIVANLLKGSATKQLSKVRLHPMLPYRDQQGRLPSMWGECQWKVYLDTEHAIDNAIHYVEENPMREGQPKQDWSFVQPFTGLPTGGWTTYH